MAVDRRLHRSGGRDRRRNRRRARSGFLDEIAADGSIVGELAAQRERARRPCARLPARAHRWRRRGVVGRRSAVVRRIGPGPGGLTALQARWVHTFTEQPFSGRGLPRDGGRVPGPSGAHGRGRRRLSPRPEDRRSRAHRRRPRELGRGRHRGGGRRQPGVHDPRGRAASRGPAERQRAMERRADRHGAEPAGRGGRRRGRATGSDPRRRHVRERGRGPRSRHRRRALDPTAHTRGQRADRRG